MEWSTIVPWQQLEQIEQDLIITTALLKIYQYPILREKIAFRGGTVLNKLYFNMPTRYSEDIGLVQVTGEPIGPTIMMLREVMDSWLGTPKRELSVGNATLSYRTVSDSGFPLKLKMVEKLNNKEFKEDIIPLLSGQEKSFKAEDAYQFIAEKILSKL